MMRTGRMNRIAVLTIAFVVPALFFNAPARALENVVTVTGEAEIAVVPDAVRIRAGVVTQGKSARESTDANSKAMTALLAALKKDGIAERDIQTSRLSIQPVRTPGRGSDSPITGFQTSNQLSVMLRETGKLSGLLDRMIEAGANDLSGIEFIVTEPGKPLDRIRAAAVEDAKRKAEIYATAAGAKLGRALTINETERGPVGFPKAGMMLRSSPVPVAAGEEILRIAVTVTYALTP